MKRKLNVKTRIDLTLLLAMSSATIMFPTLIRIHQKVVSTIFPSEIYLKQVSGLGFCGCLGCKDDPLKEQKRGVKKSDPIEVLAQLFQNQPRGILEMVLRENHGEILPSIEQLLKISQATSNSSHFSTQQMGHVHMGLLHRNQFLSRFNQFNMDAMKSAFSPINMMGVAGLTSANAMSRFPSEPPSLMGFNPYLGFRPPGIDFSFPQNAANCGHDMSALPKKK